MGWQYIGLSSGIIKVDDMVLRGMLLGYSLSLNPTLGLVTYSGNVRRGGTFDPTFQFMATCNRLL